jgi:uncharacterized protein (TIGR00725 family)
VVAVVGPAQADSDLEAQAEAVGRGLARAGAVVLCGGLGGVMAAACRGAVGAGGLTVGLLPGDDAGAANPWVQVALPTGLGELRNGLVVAGARVLVAVGGGWGTLSEIALALRRRRPVIGLRTWDLRPPDGSSAPGLVAAADPAQAVALALAAAGPAPGRSPAGG